jgi:hypothetical protein
MTFVVLSSPAWAAGTDRSAELAARALGFAPRVRLEPALGVLWADGRDLDAGAIGSQLLAAAGAMGWADARVGIAATPIAAFVAARGEGHLAGKGEGRLVVVAPGGDRDFLAPLDLGVLHPPPPPSLFPLLAGVGVECCGDLAQLDRESVEVRFGAEGMRLWRLARADDPRPIFGPRPRDLPQAELEWVDYELDRQEHVVFIVNSLLHTVCDALGARSQGAHALALEFALADRTTVTHPVRSSAPTADRRTWLRIIRAVLDGVSFDAPVTRIGLRVDAAAPLADRQGDLFDAGLATARATEAALAHLLDKQADAVVKAERCDHPLPERRLEWVAAGERHDGSVEVAVERWDGKSDQPDLRLTLQLLGIPRPVEVRLAAGRDGDVPVRYQDGLTVHPLAECLGPDQVSGGFGEARYDREYFQGIRADGMVVLLYRDVTENRWFLGGWWD